METELPRSPRQLLAHEDGFTLVELLVVIGIIVLLLGILLPAANRARQQAYQIKCMANLHSVGQAMQLYVNAYQYYPGACSMISISDSTIAVVWPVRLRAFMNGNREVFLCPSRDDRFAWTEHMDGMVAPPPTSMSGYGYGTDEPLIGSMTPFSYGYNGVGRGEGSGLGWLTDDYHRRFYGYAETRASRVRCPSEMIAVGDSVGDSVYDFIIAAEITAQPPGTIHRGGANLLFCDGHVAWFLQKDITFDESNSSVNTQRPPWRDIAVLWSNDRNPR